MSQLIKTLEIFVNASSVTDCKLRRIYKDRIPSRVCNDPPSIECSECPFENYAPHSQYDASNRLPQFLTRVLKETNHG